MKFFAWLGRCILLLGVLLPAVSLLIELCTHACAAEFFDPIPTWRHVLLVALMPLGLGLCYFGSHQDDRHWQRICSFAHGAAACSTLLYVAAMGMLNMFGLIVLPFSIPMMTHNAFIPLLALAAIGPLAALIHWLSSLRHFWRSNYRKNWAWGVALGFTVLLLAELPMVLIHGRIGQAINRLHYPTEGDAAAFERLRTPAQEAFLHRLCYTGGGVRGTGDFGPTGHLFDPQMGILGQMFNGTGYLTRSYNSNDLRDIHFRVTGESFSDLPPPSSYLTRGRRGMDFMLNERQSDFAWDEERGGDEVGARLRGLSLASSRMDWHVDAPSGLAHGEWTLEFRNQHSNAQEARCQMLLPPGGAVSRLTLWINGEPREAAFGAKSTVKAAYQQVVVRDRRDPVMVNMIGPDRIMTQCFPVPPNGLMKIRLGITAPSHQNLGMPLILDRNFSIGDQLRHSIWVQSKAAFKSSDGSTEAISGKDGTWSWQQEVNHKQSAQLSFQSLQPPAAEVWVEDSLANQERKFIQRKTVTNPSVKHSLIVVVDASSKLAPHVDTIREALNQLPETAVLNVIVSTDAGASEIKANELHAQMFRGGRNAIPAFKLAFIQARKLSPEASIIWLHGPQTVEMKGKEVLEQMLVRNSSCPKIHAISMIHGGNKLLEDIYKTTALQGGNRWDGSATGLAALLKSIHESSTSRDVYTRVSSAPKDGIKVWDHLARYAVFTEVMDAFRGSDNVPEAQAKKAAHHQLVTPYSSAVVLETQEQYDRAGLKPVDASTTPNIPMGVPEPSRTLLTAVGLTWIILQRRRKPAKMTFAGH